ncbi:hypothetical protein CVT26_005413 [Gymnopilus dilepis]|uniref:HMG box domain-containing protein n=1 Tax=Gymnopilus dilepis TaxID=231916 RepID=A0A409WGJ5_9AGAR|nr:hypothetical protein CVT26_005413 [Gymnopilus dilepis]
MIEPQTLADVPVTNAEQAGPTSIQRISAEDLPRLLSQLCSDINLPDGAFFLVVPPRDGHLPFSFTPTSSQTPQVTSSHIPRPRNAFFCFRSEYVGTHKDDGQQNLSKEAARVWSNMSEVEKQPFKEQAEMEQRLHKERYPDYVYEPAKARQAKMKRDVLRGKGSRRANSSVSTAVADALSPHRPRFPAVHGPSSSPVYEHGSLFLADSPSAREESIDALFTPQSSDDEESPSPLLVPSLTASDATDSLGNASWSRQEPGTMNATDLELPNGVASSLFSPILCDNRALGNPQSDSSMFSTSSDNSMTALNVLGLGFDGGLMSFDHAAMTTSIPGLPGIEYDPFCFHPSNGFLDGAVAGTSTWGFDLYRTGLGPMPDPIDRPISPLDLSSDFEADSTYTIGYDQEATDDEMEDAYIDFGYLSSPDIKGKGKEKVN